MSKYTTEVRFICENAAGLTESEGYNSINTVLEQARTKVFDFDYPIFDPAYKPVLEKKILKHYYTREIGCETVGLWKHFLDMKMNEIMPYYNQLYKSELLEFNPFYDVDLTTDHQKAENGSKDNSKAANEFKAYNESDTYTEDKTNSEVIQLNEDKENQTINTTEENSNNSDVSIKDEHNNKGEITTYNENKTDSDSTTKDVNKTNHNLNSTDENIVGTDLKTRTQANGETNHSETANNNTNKNDHWEYFSDTPEGGINGVANLNYLTNATHITDDGAGTTSSSVTDASKNNNITEIADGSTSGDRHTDITDDGSNTENSVENTSKDSNTDGVKDISGNENNNSVISNSSEGNVNSNSQTDGSSNTNSTTSKSGNNSSDSNRNKEGNDSKTINENSNENIHNIEDYLQHIVGKKGSTSYSKMLEEFRKTFLNIDMMIIKDLNSLFMNLW